MGFCDWIWMGFLILKSVFENCDHILELTEERHLNEVVFHRKPMKTASVDRQAVVWHLPWLFRECNSPKGVARVPFAVRWEAHRSTFDVEYPARNGNKCQTLKSKISVLNSLWACQWNTKEICVKAEEGNGFISLSFCMRWLLSLWSQLELDLHIAPFCKFTVCEEQPWGNGEGGTGFESYFCHSLTRGQCLTLWCFHLPVCRMAKHNEKGLTVY